MLAGKCRPTGRQTDAILSMTGNTGPRRLETRAIIAAGLNRIGSECCEISGSIFNILIGKTGRLRAHSRVCAITIPIAPQRNDQVARLLAAELGHTIRRIGIAIALYAMAAQTCVSQDLTALSIAFGAGALRKDGTDKNQRCANRYDFVFANHLIILRFMATPPRWAALRGRYGSDIRLRIPDYRRVARLQLHASITRSLAPRRVFAVKKGIVALSVLVALAVLITPGVIGRLAEQGVNDSLEWADSENAAFLITTTEFERGWFTSTGQHRIELLQGDLPVLVVNTHLDHGVIPVSSLFRENGSLLPGLGSAVSTLGLERSDGSVEPLPITIYTNIRLTGALQSRLIIDASGVDTANERIDWGGSEFLISSRPVDQSFGVTGTFSSLAVKSETETTLVGAVEVDLALAATPYGYVVGAVSVALDSISIIGAGQTMTAGPMSVESNSSIDGDRFTGDLALDIENTPMVLGGSGSVQLVARLENADAAAVGKVVRSIDTLWTTYGYGYAFAELEESLLTLLAGGLQLHFDQLDILSPFGQLTSRASASVEPADNNDYTWATAATLLDGSADLSLPKALVDMATQSNPEMHAVIGLGYLRKRGDFYVMAASFGDSVLTVNGAPMPIPLSGL